MRLVYAIHGYGRGHATRAAAVLPYLAAHHQVLILAGGDAYDTISPDYAAVRIPTLGFTYNSGTRERSRSNWQTLRHNLPGILDLLWQGPTFGMVRSVVEEFAPDAVIADAEAWTHHVAARLRIPRISFDHIGILRYCRAPLGPRDRLESWVDSHCYHLLTGRPDRVLVSSFYPAPPKMPGVRVVGTLPRQAAAEKLRHLGSGDKVPARPELHAPRAVVTETRRVEGKLHETLEAQPAAGGGELGANARGDRLAVAPLIGAEGRKH